MKTFDDNVRERKIIFRDYIVEAKSKGINENIFAESLSALIKTDSWNFMNRTEIEPIRGLIKEIIKKVSNGSGSSVYILDTYMGGGKTHTMAFIYFMFKQMSLAKEIDGFKDLLNELNIPNPPPVDLIAIDGNDLNDKIPLNEQEVFKEFIGKTGSREEVIKKIKDNEKPVVFLIDEILDFMDKRGENYPKDLAYLKTLIEGISETEKSVIVISFPNIKNEKYDKYRETSDIYDTLSRKGKIYAPISKQEDFAKVLKKQIFEKIDVSLLNDIDSYIKKVYTKERLDYNIKEYHEYFPFHPMLIKLIYERLSAFDGFPKTRGGIKILAHISVDLYSRIMDKKEKMSSPFISISDIDLTNENVKPFLANGNVFKIDNLEVIINKDIKGEKPLLKKILTNVYMYSLFPDKDKKGIKPSDIYISLLEIDQSIDGIEKILNDSVEDKMYLDRDNSTRKFYFKPVANIYAMIKSYVSSLSEKDNTIKQYLTRILDYSNSEIETKLIDDFDKLEINEDKIFIGALTPEIVRKYKNYTVEDTTKEIFEKLENNNLSSKNNIVILTPSYGNIEMLEEEANKYNAIIYYEKDYSKKKTPEDKEILDKIKEEKSKIEQNLTSRVLKNYSNMVYLKRDKPVRKELKNIDKEEDFRKKILDTLRDDEKAYTIEDIGNLQIESFFGTLMGERDEYGISDALKNIKKSTALPFLTKKAFDKIIIEGVKEGFIGYRIGEGGEVHYKDYLTSLNYNGTILSKDKASKLVQKIQVTTTEEPSKPFEPFLAHSTGIRVWEKDVNNKGDAEKYLNKLLTIDYKYGKYNTHIEFNLNSKGSITLDTSSEKVSDIKQLTLDLFRIFDNIEIKIKIKAFLKEDQYKDMEQ
ncbi:MAG: DUF499 domain-containing protein [Thermoplasmata archaeon]